MKWWRKEYFPVPPVPPGTVIRTWTEREHKWTETDEDVLIDLLSASGTHLEEEELIDHEVDLITGKPFPVAVCGSNIRWKVPIQCQFQL